MLTPEEFWDMMASGEDPASKRGPDPEPPVSSHPFESVWMSESVIDKVPRCPCGCHGDTPQPADTGFGWLESCTVCITYHKHFAPEYAGGEHLRSSHEEERAIRRIQDAKRSKG
jgi:hypothetical protein